MLLFIAQQADEPVIIPGVRGLPAAALAEDELVPLPGGPVPEAGGVEIYALPAVLAAADYDPVPLFHIGHVFAGLLYDSHGLVAQHVTVVHSFYPAVDQMQVRTADGG